MLIRVINRKLDELKNCIGSPSFSRAFQIVLCVFLIAFVSSCKKEETLSKDSDRIQWIRVLEDEIKFSTDDEFYEGKNGKVITDPEDNIYIYYYNKDEDKTVVKKYDPQGVLLWQKNFDDCSPLDMIRLNDGSLILAASLTNTLPNFLTLYSIKTNGTVEATNDTLKDFIYASSKVLNATLFATADNGVAVTGIWNGFVSGSNATGTSTKLFIVKNNADLTRAWSQYFGFTFPPGPIQLVGTPRGTSSITETNNGQFLVHFGMEDVGDWVDSTTYSLLSALVNSDGTQDTSYSYLTGYRVKSNGHTGGQINRNSKVLMRDFSGDFITHYSLGQTIAGSVNSKSAAFLRVGQNALVTDTIPLKLPPGYRIANCVRSASGFMMTAYKIGVASGTNDYSAAQTLFLTGGTDWQVTSRFSLQQFYSDFFFSSVASSDGGFVSMGRIQSFNGPTNKLTLIKWK
ncbi:MAG TPA: hypothetical protein PKM97_00510 [Bacteroidia bacterium]|nr:hypothetical protein [Bacteroidia bacterium]